MSALSTQGYEAVSLTLLTIALLEAALTLEIGMVTAVVGAILGDRPGVRAANPYAPPASRRAPMLRSSSRR